MVTWPGMFFAAASPPRIASIAAIAMSRLRVRYISQAHEVVESDGPVVIDAGHALDVVELSEVGQGERLGGHRGVTGEVDPVRRQRLRQPRVCLHVLHVLAACPPLECR